MGLNLARVHFDEWLHEQTTTLHEELAILEDLQRHIRRSIDSRTWIVKDNDSVRVGSYGAFDVFRSCLTWLATGEWPEPDEDYESDQYDELAKQTITREVDRGIGVARAEHFLDVGDSDTVFIPVDFDPPYENEERWIGSAPGAQECLIAFARGMDFDLESQDDDEVIEGTWQPLATARNIARLLFRFFWEEPEACVAFT